MRTGFCRRCQEQWSILLDGTLVEHPQPESPFLLCPGSRSKVETDVGHNQTPPVRAAQPRQERAQRVPQRS